MKKLLALALCALTCAVAAAGFVACAKKDGATYSVYAPDGAPALALTQLMSGDKKLSQTVDYHIVVADTITSYVTYEDDTKNADLIVMPVNAASKLLGNGEKYKMLGSVTNGNLYILSASDKTTLTKDNFAAEIGGKKVGVVQLPMFPGVMFKTLLKKYETSAELSPVQPAQVSGDADFDYFVLPEPAATTRAGNQQLNLKVAGDLQTLYGDNGYPQAVLLAKNSIIESNPDFIKEFTGALSTADSYLKNTPADNILSTIKAHYADPDNTTPAFNTLSATVIDHCGIKFRPSSECKQDVKSLLDSFVAVDTTFARQADDSFFYAA